MYLGCASRVYHRWQTSWLSVDTLDASSRATALYGSPMSELSWSSAVLGRESKLLGRQQKMGFDGGRARCMLPLGGFTLERGDANVPLPSPLAIV